MSRLFRRERKNGNGVAAVAASENGKQPLICLRDIVKTFSTAAGDFTVLKGIDADFYSGEFGGFFGYCGCG